MRHRRSVRWTRVRRVIGMMAVVALCATAAPIGAVEGPVPAGSLPGGATEFDTDDGSGEQWGRLGGRDKTFSGFDLALFTLLRWGPVNASSVGIAFDGAITPGTDEVLSFSAGSSDLANGVAVWLGQTSVHLNSGASIGDNAVDTRFVLTVTDASANPVALVIDAGTGVPRVDVLAVPGQFTANLRMEAKLASDLGDFQPALDLFDALPTDPGDLQLAQTSFSQGFFFESADTLSLSEHDANMEARTAEILGLLDFHTIDTRGRLIGLAQAADEIQAKLMQLLAEEPVTRTEVEALLASVEQSLLDAIDQIEATASPLAIQAISSGKQKPLERKLTVLATENGSMIDQGFAVELVAAIPADGGEPILLEFAASEIVPGLAGLVHLELVVPLSLEEMSRFLVVGRHSDVGNPDHDHQGFTLAVVGFTPLDS